MLLILQYLNSELAERHDSYKTLFEKNEERENKLVFIEKTKAYNWLCNNNNCKKYSNNSN